MLQACMLLVMLLNRKEQWRELEGGGEGGLPRPGRNQSRSQTPVVEEVEETMRGGGGGLPSPGRNQSRSQTPVVEETMRVTASCPVVLNLESRSLSKEERRESSESS